MLRPPARPRAASLVLVSFLILALGGGGADAFAADPAWSWGHPLPQGNPIFGLAAGDDGQTAWAVARGGQVLRSTDGAVTWQLTHGLGVVGTDLMDIVMLPGGTLIAGGDGLHRSLDGGDTWEALIHPAAGLLYDLALIPGGGVSAAGDGGAVLVSFDGGDEWAAAGPGTGLIRHHVWRSATDAFVVGDFVNLHTIDGGATWTDTFPDSAPFLSEIFFTGPDTGFIAEAFQYWRTSDGGATWTANGLNDTGPLYRYRTLLVTPDHWLVTAHGEGGELWETLDGGETWAQLHFTWHVGYPAIAALPGGRVIVAGDEGSLYRSDDAGHTLVPATANVGAATIYATVDILAARPDGTLFAFGDPTVTGIPPVWMRSDDGGRSWTDGGDLDAFVAPGTVAFFDDAIGLAGAWNTVLRTVDGGANWAPTSWSGGGYARSFAMPATDRFFVAGANGSGGGSLYLSADGGLSWAPVGGGLPIGTFDAWAVAFGDADTGIVSGTVGGAARTYRTVDGGANWAPVAGLPGAIDDLSWPEPGFVAGTIGADVVRSTDGGATWHTVGAGAGSRATFRDAQHGAAWDFFGGGLRLTADGGNTWTPTPLPFASPVPPGNQYLWVGAVLGTPTSWVVGGAELKIVVGLDAELAPVPPGAGAPRPAVRLDDPWPNPANPRAEIRYHLERAGPVLVTVHDVAGRRLRTLVRDTREAGAHVVTWPGDDDRGRAVASGPYLVQVVSRDGRATTKLTLVR